MKKLAAILLTAVLVTGSVLPCFAAESPSGYTSDDFTVTVEDEEGNEDDTSVSVTYDDDHDTAVEEAQKLVDEDDSVSGAIAISISSQSDDQKTAMLEGVEGYDEETATIAVSYVVTLVGTAAASSSTVTVPVAGVTESNLVTVLFKEEGSDTWVEVDASTVTVTEEGKVVIAGVTVSGEYSFIVEKTESSTGDGSTGDGSTGDGSSSGGSTGVATSSDSQSGGDTDTDTTTTAASGTISQKTGDISIAVPIALLVVAAVAIVILLARGKKEEN